MEIILLILAYIIGSIPTGLWIGKLFFNINLREHGSGNIGTTNAMRILGKKAGWTVWFIDFFKGTLAACLPLLFHVEGNLPRVLFGLAAVLGHVFPVFAGFKGGKAVATTCGMLIGINPLFGLSVLLTFLVFLYLTSMVSFAALATALLGMVSTLLFPAYHIFFSSYDWIFIGICWLAAIMIFFRHKENIGRILKKEENTTGFGLNLLQQGSRKQNND
ncbi:glycerol-3-phosphate 1-O-acyltransferase PlsY [Streptococcus sp. DD13]|uniref:glycerol-3-phosphate 1-O-acyltransferase PlsY n=1 Tax=Streptococcus sp. DD13 TaxID=1777881 RepID=UPI00079BD072|nr:glycerol-3-phosphate 1-O-acyltransferase PlsY [Streptococcus sp. DD13]KXT78796.1 Acyl-phosphate:glycerol-3-phosphate O-acyltransferase PlsY [Streptococcus sp. DD13]